MSEEMPDEVYVTEVMGKHWNGQKPSREFIGLSGDIPDSIKSYRTRYTRSEQAAVQGETLELLKVIADLSVAFEQTGQKHPYMVKHAAIIEQARKATDEGGVGC